MTVSTLTENLLTHGSEIRFVLFGLDDLCEGFDLYVLGLIRFDELLHLGVLGLQRFGEGLHDRCCGREVVE